MSNINDIDIRKVASPHVRFASQIRTPQGNLTLLYTEKSLKILKYQEISRFFLYNEKSVFYIFKHEYILIYKKSNLVV